MFRVPGVRRKFNNIQEGETVGFFATFNEAAQDNKRRHKAMNTLVDALPPDDAPPAPPVEKETVTGEDAPAETPDAPDGDAAPPAPPVAESTAPRQPCPDLNRSQVLKLAEEHGLDTSVHHMTLRTQVEEILNAQSGSDQPGIRPDTD